MPNENVRAEFVQAMEDRLGKSLPRISSKQVFHHDEQDVPRNENKNSFNFALKGKDKQQRKPKVEKRWKWKRLWDKTRILFSAILMFTLFMNCSFLSHWSTTGRKNVNKKMISWGLRRCNSRERKWKRINKLRRDVYCGLVVVLMRKGLEKLGLEGWHLVYVLKCVALEIF